MWRLKVKAKPSYNHVSLLALLALSEQFLSSNQVFFKEKVLTILESQFLFIFCYLSIYIIYIFLNQPSENHDSMSALLFSKKGT